MANAAVKSCVASWPSPNTTDTVTYQRYTQRECRTIYCVVVISSLMGKCREVAGVRARLKVTLPWSRTLRRAHTRWGNVQKEQQRAPEFRFQFQSPGTPSSCSAGSSLRLWHGSMASWSKKTWINCLFYSVKEKKKNISNKSHWCGENKIHTPSSKAQRLLTSCSLWLNTSCRISITLWRMFSISVTLYIKTHKKTHGQHPRVYVTISHSPLDVKLLVLQPRIYITISLPETRSL